MRRFLKKFTEGNARNSRLINCADVTTIRKTRVVWGRVSKIHARADTRVHIEHTATENMWFLRKERKPLLKPLAVYYYYYGDISPVEKGEMFSSKYLTIVAKIRAVVVTRVDGDHRRTKTVVVQGSQ